MYKYWGVYMLTGSQSRLFAGVNPDPISDSERVIRQEGVKTV